jgi:hypothetical protein
MSLPIDPLRRFRYAATLHHPWLAAVQPGLHVRAFAAVRLTLSQVMLE